MTNRRITPRIAGAAVAVAIAVALLGTAIVAGPFAGRNSASTQSPTAPVSSADYTSATPSAGPSVSTSDSGSPPQSQPGTPSVQATPSATPPSTPTPALGLPTLLAAIGDSYSQAYNVTPTHRYDNPEFSWVVGSAAGDGVYSIRERLEALGAHLTVVDAATSGRKMSDAPRQAENVVAAARKLAPGQTAYVTFELGTNDLCDNAGTTPADFEAQLNAAVAILQGGLPAGSGILMLPIPDFYHFHSITQADAKARTSLALPVNSRNCAPFLGSNGPLTLDQARAAMAQYNSILLKVCDGIQSRDGASGRLSCRTDLTQLSERDFQIGDLSAVDYFHPSLSGQARIAAAAWGASEWPAVSLPAGD